MANETGTLESIAISAGAAAEPLSERLREGQVGCCSRNWAFSSPGARKRRPVYGRGAQRAVSIEALPSLTEALLDAVEARYRPDRHESLALIDVVRRTSKGLIRSRPRSRTRAPRPACRPPTYAFAAELPSACSNTSSRATRSDPRRGGRAGFHRRVERTEATPARLTRQAAVYRRVLHVDQLVEFLESPLDHLQALYGWVARR